MYENKLTLLKKKRVPEIFKTKLWKKRPSISEVFRPGRPPWFRHQVRREVLSVNGVLTSFRRPHNLNAWNRLTKTQHMIFFYTNKINK